MLLDKIRWKAKCRIYRIFTSHFEIIQFADHPLVTHALFFSRFCQTGSLACLNR